MATSKGSRARNGAAKAPTVAQLKTAERVLEQVMPSKGPAERKIEKLISERTGKPYKGAR